MRFANFLAVALSVWPIFAGYQGAAWAAADVPTVRAVPASDGPIATSAAALVQAAGYVEKEFFFEGMAQSFAKSGEFGSDGRWTAVPADRAPFKVRMIVRTPTDPKRFNGVVFVEWLNVSGQSEAGPNFTLLSAEMFRDGYAYVGVGAQLAGLEGTSGLRATNPARYGSLQHPGDSFSYDIYSQAGQAVRTPSGVAPLGDLTNQVRFMLADGESQSAGRMVTYVNAVQPLANVYDGFFIHSRSGGGAALAQTQGADTRPAIPVANPARIRGDLKVPVIQLQTETDVRGFVNARQPDDARVRTWELAGTSHADRFLLTSGGQNPESNRCPDPDPALVVPVNDGPQTFLLRAALRQMRRWMEGGAPPPIGAPITLEGTTVVRDPVTGLARGGVRSPQVDVPVRTLSGIREPASGGQFCGLFGRTDEWNGNKDPWDGNRADPSPTPEPVLSTLYPTKADFLTKFDRALQQGIANGFLLQEDAEEMRAEAMRRAQTW